MCDFCNLLLEPCQLNEIWLSEVVLLLVAVERYMG